MVFTPQFAFAISGLDALGVVLRAHIEIELLLVRFIDVALPAPDKLGRLSFALHIRLALACGLRPSLGPPLTALDRLRNEFAHRSGRGLTTEDVQRLYDAFSDGDKAAADYGFSAGETPIVERSPRDRLVFYAIVLWDAIQAETRRFERSDRHT